MNYSDTSSSLSYYISFKLPKVFLKYTYLIDVLDSESILSISNFVQGANGRQKNFIHLRPDEKLKLTLWIFEGCTLYILYVKLKILAFIFHFDHYNDNYTHFKFEISKSFFFFKKECLIKFNFFL